MIKRFFCQKTCKTYDIYFVRHGESEWNQKNLFCGWYDASLSAKGIVEARTAGKTLKQKCIYFDLAYTSVLKRAYHTLAFILKEMDLMNIPVRKSWRLNERHYGSLTGLNKVETVQKYGMEQVKIWRRSFNIPPPKMCPDHKYFKCIVCDPIYKDGPPKDQFPMTESLELTIKRTMPLWECCIVPEIKCGRKIIVAAHGNSLRGIVKMLDCISEKDIVELNLPTGIPFKYTLDEDMRPVKGGSMQFLGDPAKVKEAIEKVKGQIKEKK